MSPRLCLLFAAVAAGSSALTATEHPLTLDPQQSRIEVIVKASFSDFTGQLTRYDAGVTLDDDGRVCGARLRFEFSALTTGKPDRDKAMLAWEQADTFPSADFVLTSLQPAASGGFEAAGRFTFHGVTRDLKFPVTISRDGALYAIDGEVPIDTRHHGLPVIRMMVMLKVDPVVRVRFHIQGRRSS